MLIKMIFQRLSPIQKVLISFIFLILSGSILLLLPISTHHGISFIDALFTSTSAVCVTGLIVLDTPVEFTVFGICVILLLIQFGGLGIMTFSMGLLSMFANNLSLKWRFTFQDLYSGLPAIPIRSLLKRIVFYTFIIESVIAAILFTQFIRDFPLFTALGHAVFHSISAFCNAGFSTFSDSLIGYNDNPLVILPVSMGIILGGLGFIVLYELRRYPFIRNRSWNSRLSHHTRIVLIITAILIVSGTAGFLALEWNHTLKTMPFWERLLASFFQSITCRTAGFNSVDIPQLRQNTLYMMIVLMFIGGSPGSIAGGIKTTTVGVMAMLIYSKFRGARQIVLWNRGLDHDTVDRCTTLIILSMVFVIIASFAVLTIHNFDIHNSFLSAVFEVVSAFGTVGLSMGATGHLSLEGKVLICVVMFIGRLGPLTLIMALTSMKKDINIEYPEEHIMIG